MIKCTFATIIGKDFCFDEWLKMVKRVRMPKKDMMLLWLVNSNLDYDRILTGFNQLKRGFKESLIMPTPFRFYDHQQELSSAEGFVKKRWAVAFNMNLLNQYRKGDLFVIEDDIFTVPYAYERLSSLARIEKVGAATALGASHKESNPLKRHTAWMFIKHPLLPPEKIVKLRELVPDFDFYDYEIYTQRTGKGVEDIHAAGTVCTYINEKCLKHHIFKGESNICTGQDVNLGFSITQQMGLRYLADWDIPTEHWELDSQENIIIV